MGKRILLISPNFSPEPTGIGKYNGELITALAARGVECTVITAYPYYPDRQLFAAYRPKRYWYSKERLSSVTVYRCPQYITQYPTARRRIFQELTFFFTAFIKLLQLLPGGRFDVVITIGPPFHTGLLAIFYKWIRKTIFIYHLQDLQIEVAAALRLIHSERLLNILRRVEQLIFKHADHISSIAPGMIKKIKEKTTKEVYYFPNWVNTSIFFPLPEKEKLKTRFGFNANDKIILYAGAIAEKQGFDILLTVAEKMKQYDYIKFVVCGAGIKLNSLKARAPKNLFFLPVQPLDSFNELLNMADLHLILQRTELSNMLFPSKLTTILAIGGIALVSASEESDLYTLIREHHIGIPVDAGCETNLQQAISDALKKEHTEIAANARRYAENNLSANYIISAFCADLLNSTGEELYWHNSLMTNKT